VPGLLLLQLLLLELRAAAEVHSSATCVELIAVLAVCAAITLSITLIVIVSCKALFCMISLEAAGC
jgi:hypothetical protein